MTGLERLEAQILAEFRGFVADDLLEQITCFSAEPEFQRLGNDLAAYLGISAKEACGLLLVTSRAIVAAAKNEAQNQSRGQVRHAA